MLRVLHVIDDLAPGGAQTQLRLLAEAGASSGDAVTVAVGRYPGRPGKRLDARGIAVTWLGRRFPFDPFAVRRLVATVRRSGAEVVQSWDAKSAWLCQAAQRWSPAPWVHTVREPLDDRRWRPDGLLLAHESLADPEQRGILGVVPNAVDPTIAAAAPSDKSEARARLRERGVDTREEAPVIATAIRMDDAAPAKELAWAADLVRVVCPGLRLLVAGEGPARAAAERFAAKACDPGTVVWLGEWTDLAGLYTAADVVWCGAGAGALPTPAVEGMAAGKPVVVAEARGREHFASAEPGVQRLTWNDRAGWARATKRLLTDPAFASKVGHENAAWARSAHGLESAAAAHRDLLARAARPSHAA